MLNDNLKLYEQVADRIEGWRKINKNDLFNLYIKHEDDKYLSEAYFSAIVARYWRLIDKYYYNSKFGIDAEDCYTWLIDSVAYVLEHRAWTVSGSKLYGDPNGPDKALNTKMRCARLTHYQLLNKDKRSSNLGVISIEELTDESGDLAVEFVGATSDPEFSATETVTEKMVVNCVNAYDYFTAVLVDMIMYQDVFEYRDDKSDLFTSINKRKVHKLIKEFDDSFYKSFSERYRVSDKRIKDMREYFSSLKQERIYELIDYSLSKLRNSKMKKMITR